MSWYLDVGARNKAREEMAQQNAQLREQRQSKLRELKSTHGYPTSGLPSLPTSTSFSTSSSAIRSGNFSATPPPEGSSPHPPQGIAGMASSPKIVKPQSPPQIVKRMTTSQLVVGTLRPKSKLLKKCALFNALAEAQRTEIASPTDEGSNANDDDEQQQQQQQAGEEAGVVVRQNSAQQHETNENNNDNDSPPSKPNSKNSYTNRITVSNTLLGTGAFGAVYLGMDEQTGELVAVKKISLAPAGNKSRADAKAQLELLATEIRLMKNLNHKNVVKYIHAERKRSDLFIYMEYMSGGSLASLLSKFQKLSEPVLKIYISQVLRGLQYLHRKNIVHRDMKADNVLISADGVAKISDFGTSREFNDSTNLLTVTGTPWFMAPEVVKGTGHGTAADIWSVGCTMIHLATGKVPFGEYSNPITAMYNIALHPEKVLTEIPPVGTISPQLYDAIVLCLAEAPSQRITAEQLLDHPFFLTEGTATTTTTKASGSSSGREKLKASVPAPRTHEREDDAASPAHTAVPAVPLHEMQQQQQFQLQQQQQQQQSPLHHQVRHGDVPVVVPLNNRSAAQQQQQQHQQQPRQQATTTSYISQQQHHQHQQPEPHQQFYGSSEANNNNMSSSATNSGTYGTPRSYASRLRESTQNSYVLN